MLNKFNILCIFDFCQRMLSCHYKAASSSVDFRKFNDITVLSDHIQLFEKSNSSKYAKHTDKSMATMQVKKQILLEIRNATLQIEHLSFVKQLFEIDLYYYYAAEVRTRLFPIRSKSIE